MNRPALLHEGDVTRRSYCRYLFLRPSIVNGLYVFISRFKHDGDHPIRRNESTHVDFGTDTYRRMP